MNLRPIGDRILIKPDVPPDVTDSGIILAEQRKPEETGTVVAVGLCPHPLKHEANGLAAELEVWADEWKQSAYFDISDDFKDLAEVLAEGAAMLSRVTAREPLVKVGDYVVFSWIAGQELTVDDERYLLMREADILCVVEGVTV